VGGLAEMISGDEWQYLVSVGNLRRFPVGKSLMRQGDPADCVMLLGTGRVKVLRVDASGNCLLLAVRGPGELIGEIGLFGDGRRSGTVTAIEACRASVITADRFTAVVRSLGLENVLLRHMSRRLCEGEDIRAELAALPADRRIACALLRWTEPLAVGQAGIRQGERVCVGLRQMELAYAAGLARSTLAAELNELRARGIIATGRRQIVITDLAKLRQVAQG